MDEKLAAVRCRDLANARVMVTRLVEDGFGAKAIEHAGHCYAVVTENSAGTVDDTVFELSWHALDAGTIPAEWLADSLADKK